jgi:hypothetical protein
MSEAWRTYSAEIQDNLDHRATWPPDAPRAIGDIGRLTRDRYDHVTSLDRLRIKFSTRCAAVGAEFRYATAGAVSFGANASGQGPAGGSPVDVTGEFTVSFKKASAVAFLATGCQVTQMDDLDRIEKEVLRRLRFNDWDATYVVVTEVVRAGSTTVLVAGGTSSSVIVKGAAEVKAGPLSLDSLRAGVELARANDMALQILAKGELVPLFQVHGVRKGFLQQGRFVRRGEGPGATPPRGVQQYFGQIPFGLD